MGGRGHTQRMHEMSNTVRKVGQKISPTLPPVNGFAASVHLG